ncbi:MAG TPA: hypothetical protein VFW46_14660 [Stellaceae bacterium]|nr:hypothetical protein [Stellaceae bacterium]
MISEVSERFGLVPNFFRSAAAAPGLIEQMWRFARAAYVDNPLPSLFKERLFVHLSRFCKVRYCIVRHVGFLIGEGNPAGDPAAVPESLAEALALLRRPLPNAAALDLALRRLEAHAGPPEIPAPATPPEADLFDALAIIFLQPFGSTRAVKAVRRVAGDADAESLVAFLAFVRTAHFWTETHPEIVFEPDMVVIMQRHKELSRLLLDTADARRGMAGAQLLNTPATRH